MGVTRKDLNEEQQAHTKTKEAFEDYKRKVSVKENQELAQEIKAHEATKALLEEHKRKVSVRQSEEIAQEIKAHGATKLLLSEYKIKSNNKIKEVEDKYTKVLDNYKAEVNKFKFLYESTLRQKQIDVVRYIKTPDLTQVTKEQIEEALRSLQ